MTTRYCPASVTLKLVPVPCWVQTQEGFLLAQLSIPTAGQLASLSFSQIMLTALVMLVWMNRLSFNPHKNMLGSCSPSFGQVTISSAKGSTGLVWFVPKRVTVMYSVIPIQGGVGVLTT